ATSLQSLFVKNYRASNSAARNNSFTRDAAPITAVNLYASVQHTYEFLTTPSLIGNTLAHKYVAFGADAYMAITTALSVHRALVEQSGSLVLARATAARDLLATTPRRIVDTHLALGNAVITASHFAIRADVSTAHTIASAAPATARATVAFIGGAGDALANAAARVAIQTPAALALAMRSFSEAGPRFAHAVFGAEYAAASRFVAFISDVTGGYARVLHSLGQAGYIGTAHTLALVDNLEMKEVRPLSLFAGAINTFEDLYLSALGRTAVMLESPTSTQGSRFPHDALAAVVAGLSAGEQAALITYETIRNIVDSANRALVAFFTTTPSIVLPDGARPKTKLVVETPPVRTTVPSPGVS
ncbi:MAG: hypothetical protein AAB951_00945, partial [Patescibacteria group bacterium]